MVFTRYLWFYNRKERPVSVAEKTLNPLVKKNVARVTLSA
jgi:hypothetical protein